MASTTYPSDLISPESLRRAPTRAEAWQGDGRALELDLKRVVTGEVRFDAGSKAMYSLDAGNYRYVPIGVVIPRSKDDAIAAIAACRRHGAPIVSRAGGTALAGQTCNTAVVLDWSKYVNHIVELDPVMRFARVEPGVICDEVVHAAQPYRLTWAPQPATHNHCCFGGMLGNNSCGIHAQMAGKAVDNTEELDVLLYDGTRMHVGWMDDEAMRAKIQAGGREGQIYAQLRALRDRYANAIRERFPKLPRRVSGYNLDQLLPGEDGRFNIARALIGSEGTLVTILEAKIRLVYNHPKRVLVVIGYHDVFEAADHVMEVLEAKPIGLEGLDQMLVDNVHKKHGPHEKFVPLLPKGRGWLLVELGYDTMEEAKHHGEQLMERLRASKNPPVDMKMVVDHAEQVHLWEVRESGLGATAFVPGQPDAWPGWEDSAVRPELLGGYLRDLRKLFDKFGYHPALYGHFGMGCVHCRVDFDLYTKHGVEHYRRFMREASELVTRYDGSLSGEHGDGQARAEFLPIMFGQEIVQAFREYKAIWDPEWKMNPGRIVDPPRVDQNLRLGGGYNPWEPETHFKYPEDHGSFAHATLRCVGIGKCRRKSGQGGETHDTMCPSFMVTHEEKHTTRGRAHLLHEMLVKGPIKNGWRDENVKDALDLCLSCKGCKGDCPVNVDIATYKAEFLSHYYEGRIRPRTAYAFGLIDQWARVGSLAPGLLNAITQTPGLSAIAKLVAGMPQARSIPPFAPTTFRQWWKAHVPKNKGAKRVVLWADTFNNYFMPETAQAAVDVLEDAGYHVHVIEKHVCCGRPLYDFGMLDLAKRYLDDVLANVRPFVDDEVPVVVLEPSCASVFRDELRNLLPNREDGKRFSSRVLLLSELLKNDGYSPPQLDRRAVVQGHCHHKSVLGFDAEKEILGRMGLDVQILESGCCGMAGSFGFEKDKYPVSVAEGERVLLPKVRDAGPHTIVVADGFSCREQIAQGSDRRGLHLAEVLKLAIDHGPRGPIGEYPERIVTDGRDAKIRASRRNAAVIALGALGAIAIGLSVRRWLRR